MGDVWWEEMKIIFKIVIMNTWILTKEDNIEFHEKLSLSSSIRADLKKNQPI